MASSSFGDRRWSYRLEPEGTAIGDMTALDDQRFLVIERNDGTATNGIPPFKRVFLIDLGRLGLDGMLDKTQVLDLMEIADPWDLDGDGSTRFTFPFITVESLLILDARRLLIANDNNYPAGGGRDLESDATELIVVELERPLPVTPPH